MDLHSKYLLESLESYLEDTPNLFWIFQTENEKGHQSVNSFPVTVDVVPLHTNIPTHSVTGRLEAFKKALQNQTVE